MHQVNKSLKKKKKKKKTEWPELANDIRQDNKTHSVYDFRISC
jgi:hypothetical protein